MRGVLMALALPVSAAVVYAAVVFALWFEASAAVIAVFLEGLV